MSFEITQEPLEQAAQKAAEIFVEIYRGLESRRVAPERTCEQLIPEFADTMTELGVGLEQAVTEFQERILPHCMGTASPMYMGLVNSSPLPAGALADLFVSALNNNGGALHQHPSIYALEYELLGQYSDLVYGHRQTTGMLLPGGTFANLQSLMLARAKHFPQWVTEGPHALEKRPRLYVSEATHFCVDRSAQVLGLGSGNIVPVPALGRGVLDTAQLRRQIEQDLKAGYAPFCAVATLGTTGTGAIDPLAEVSQVCQEFGLWFHVDGCYGGATILLEEMKPRLEALKTADSVAIDPHKWFFVPMVAGLMLTRHRELESQAFLPSSSSYIPGRTDLDPYLRGIPTSRRASALAVWMSIRAHGWKTVRDAVRKNIELTRLLEELLRNAGFEVLPGGELSVACARAPGSDQLQSEIAQRVIDSGQGWMSTVVHAGRTWLRCNIVNLHVREKHVEKMAKLLAQMNVNRPKKKTPG